jgi:DNA-binding MarR family transcriptional regulator
MVARDLRSVPWAASSEQIGRELSQAFSEIVLRRIALIENVSAEIGLSELQARMLFHIDPKAPVPMSEVARRAGYEPSNLTGIIDKLEARGLVKRRSANDDRRVKRVSLTRAGAALRKQLIARLYAPEPWMLALSAEDQRLLRDILRRALAFGQSPPGRVNDEVKEAAAP